MTIFCLYDANIVEQNRPYVTQVIETNFGGVFLYFWAFLLYA